MTSLIVKKTKDESNTPVTSKNDQIVEGMKDAGYVMNWLIKTKGKRKQIFKQFYRKIILGKFNANETTSGGDLGTNLSRIKDSTYILTVDTGDPGLLELEPIGNKYRKFMVKGDPDKVIKITVNIDAEDSDELDDFTHMHIAVPPNNTDLLKDGYIGTVFSDIKKIVDPNDTLGTAHDEQAKQYLLANLFLSRCR